MITKEELHKIYLHELTQIDTTHGGHVKNRHPEFWDILGSSISIDLDKALLDPSVDIWLWSDQHFNHKNIIKYSNRPYKDIIDMNEQLIHNHNSVVKPGDIVIWGGDIGFGNINQVNQYLDRCNGYKVHILGNHDMFRDGKLYDLHVSETHPCLTFQVGNIQLLLTHYPIDVIPEDCIGIHGHIHTHKAFTPRHINISVEQINYTPININTIISNLKL